MTAASFMLPLAGMLFLGGVLAHQFAGVCLADEDRISYVFASFGGLALQIAAVTLLSA